ncbi:MAG: homoserine O-succinyltransferase [Candidatus Lambdaproteobacteria bacterium RIFOXYD1_FULL_56_27]|uniref:Homoserine O-acetyltransferase n=1 Tax=Candidatus Lambdaproteobacteria bacterium RIFOXYD2_FULL_56_26 TaxID=1817773 RepID=A0A1F6GMU4_9PROT|nr:MAG: homoserine O-succinyltransferase [Candidatus Lambdaproteobacteria bacterium RIFOXYD2_FULL_56_26]OGH05590.1 MAG: homoserine O-succinyltransferase [Candidatus Lambdaproteobacteria bacterium RIFOXYC1_FULL_56_13]OGH08550.1 MAG: homoserine O-succinyltransferase [Candidatus Lambdaproteobacteria bacterium RIFOXYD1_FULL_56_27]
MTVILPKDYHAQEALESNNITCIHPQSAERQDIRPLRIGILNIMPNVKSYEFNLLYPLGKSILQIDPVWIKLDSHAYKSSSSEHLAQLYISFEEAIAHRHLDGLILTGAPVEELEFEAINYWPEIKVILDYARTKIASTIGICWGAMALAKMVGINKVLVPKKIFGVYKTRNLDTGHNITGDLDDYFHCPQSRHAGYPDAVLEAARDQGLINLLGYSPEAGYTIFETTDQRYLMHLGHPEYNSGRLVEEFHRDQNAGRPDVDPPVNFDVANPVNSWRSHRNEFFSQWIKYVYLKTDY